MNRTRAAALLLLVALMIAPAAVGEPTLKVGDPAPPLAVGKWLRGGPVERLEPGTVYVVEFWATWCGPCRAMPPHLSGLQARYQDKGVKMIGVDVWEREPEALGPFMKRMGERMKYAVAADDRHAGDEGKMAVSWMKASGTNSIPFSFLVDQKGRVAWTGYPMMVDRPLAAVVAGTFDPAEQDKFEAKIEAMSEQLDAAMKAKDYDAALGVLDQMTRHYPPMASQYALRRVTVLMQKGDYAAANRAAGELAAGDAKGNDFLQGTLAGTLLSAHEETKVDNALALRLAESVYEANGKEGWQYQNLLATAHAANGQFEQAIELQAKVVAGAPSQYRGRMQNLLDQFKQRAGENAKEKK